MESLAIIVIPCYNEATRLQVSTFKAFTCTWPAVRFLFVDDASTDRTRQVLEGLHQDDPQHFAICHCDFNHKVAQTAMIWLNASTAMIWLKTCKRVAFSISMS